MGAGVQGGYNQRWGGATNFPTYMKNVHKDWLNKDAAVAISTSIVDLMNSNFGNSPFAGKSSADISTQTAAIDLAPVTLQSLVNMLSMGNSIDHITASIIGFDRVKDSVDSYQEAISAKYLQEDIRDYEISMLQIGAVNSSAFTIGKAVIENNLTRDIADYQKMLYDNTIKDQIEIVILKFISQNMSSFTSIESNRIKIVANMEENNHNIALDDSNYRWDFEALMQGGNLLGVATPIAMRSGEFWQYVVPRPVGVARMTMTGWLYGGVLGAIVYMLWGAYESFTTDDPYWEGS
jgi:hypothetical protein